MEFVITVSIYLLFFAVWAFLSIMTLFMMFRYHGLSLMVWGISLLYAVVSGGIILITVSIVSHLEIDWTSLLYFYRGTL